MHFAEQRVPITFTKGVANAIHLPEKYCLLSKLDFNHLAPCQNIFFSVAAKLVKFRLLANRFSIQQQEQTSQTPLCHCYIFRYKQTLLTVTSVTY
jgi:hypothetical protein